MAFLIRNSFLAILLSAALFVPTSIPKASEICKSLTANGINNWYPFVYRNGKNELIGTIPDVARIALDRIGLKMEVHQDLPWKRILHQLETGKLDIVLGAYWNSDRAKKFHYSEVIGQDEIRVFVKKGNEFSLNSYEDLIGRIGLKLLGGSYGDEFDKFAAERLDFNEIPKSEQMINMLTQERADFGILGYVEGLQHAKNLGISSQIVALPWPILSNNMYFMVSRSAPCAHRMEELNAIIRNLKKEGILDQIYIEHLGQNAPPPQ